MNLKTTLFITLSLTFCALVASEDIFRKPVRTKRPNKVKEEIAQQFVHALEYSTELLDVQGQLQLEILDLDAVKAIIRYQARSITSLAWMQQELYKRIKELAEGTKNAFINRASSRELQNILEQTKKFNEKNKNILTSLKKELSELKKLKITKTRLPQKIAQLENIEKDFLILFRSQSKFFACECANNNPEYLGSTASDNKIIGENTLTIRKP